MKRTLFSIAAIALMIATSCCNTADKPKNVIYLIGDGMGFGAVSSLLLSEEGVTGFEQAPIVGISETCSANNFVTDSPAGGTALATGTRTKNGYLGVDPDGNQLTSVLRKAQALGKKSGIVVNTTLTEATPGAFYGGVISRYMTYDIAKQFTESHVDVAIGAGLDDFINRPDSLDLTAVLIEKGYDVYLHWEQVLDTQSDKFVGILPLADVHRREKSDSEASAAEGQEICLAARLAAAEGSSSASHLSEPTVYLEKAASKALDVLSRNNKDGFFLMIESAIIDGYGHNNDSDGMIVEMREFDRTLRQLIEYVNAHPETLLVVTADHETGGTMVDYKSYEVGEGEKSEARLAFRTKGHSGTVVPVFAYGKGAEKFAGVMKNIDIPKKIEELMN